MGGRWHTYQGRRRSYFRRQGRSSRLSALRDSSAGICRALSACACCTRVIDLRTGHGGTTRGGGGYGSSRKHWHSTPIYFARDTHTHTTDSFSAPRRALASGRRNSGEVCVY